MALHEWVAAPLAVGLAFAHVRRAWGAGRAALECGALVLYGFLLEWTAMRVFASHRYAPEWRVDPFGVPLAVAAVWAAVILSAAAVSASSGGIARRALSAALLAVTLDLGIEPAAVHLGLWEWTPRGPWLGVPVGNFVGWAVIVAGYVWGLERWPVRSPGAGAVLRRAALVTGCVAALVAVGLCWTALGAERLFADGRGWIAWAAALAATAAVCPRLPRGAVRPALALAVVSLTFLADAATAGGAVLLSALGPAAVLSWRLRVES